MTERIYDLFITHAWRYHDDWTRIGEMFDKALGDPGAISACPGTIRRWTRIPRSASA